MIGRSWVFVAVLAGVSGCSGLLHRDAEPAQMYVLRAAAAAAVQAAAADAPSLRVGRTQTAPGLDSDRIVLMHNDHRMDFYATSRWAAPVPEVVEALAVETLRNSGAWSAVHDSQGAFPTDYFLQVDIRRFEADYTGGGDPKVYVTLGCTLGRRSDREDVRSFVAEGSAVAGANRLSAVVAAFESAAQTAMAALAQDSRNALAELNTK
jgi:cholesterol transport system auxiliary component